MNKLCNISTLLYQDICRAGDRSEDIFRITKKQTEILLSLVGNGINPESREDTRRWRVLRKGKHGGCLRLPILAEKFFSFENT